MPRRMSKLVCYLQSLKRSTRPFNCPDCNVSVLPQHFEKHCLSRHGLNAKRCCVWCGGEQSWPTGEKHLNAPHLLDCFTTFYDETNSGNLKLNHYLRYVNNKSKINFTCPRCETPVKSNEFEKHCESHHALDPKQCCVWCWGAYIWKKNTKSRHAHHLIHCFRKWLTTTVTPITPTRAPRLLNTQPLCPPRDFFGHEDLCSSLDPLAFHVLNDRLLEDRVDYFEDDNLNVAASLVRLFVTTHEKRADWIHVMVKAVSMDSFIQAVQQEKGRVKLLPFSCWCDGGPHAEARFRQHRHCVVVCAPKKHFEKQVWPQVRASEKPFGGFQSKGSQCIQSPMHLVNTLGYLCKRESRCNFKIDNKKGPVMDKHFFIFKSLPVDYLLPLSLQWDGGILKMLHQIQFQNVSVLRLMKSDLVFDEGKWKQKIQDFYGFEGGWVLPLRKGYAPTKEKTARCVHLVKGQKMYLEPCDEATWLEKQVARGNCFYERVGEELWTPRKRDQVKLNLIMPLWERNGQLEKEAKQWKRAHKEELDQLKEEVTRSKEELEQSKEEATRLKEEVINLKRKHKKEIKKLQDQRKINKIEYEKNVKVKLSLDS